MFLAIATRPDIAAAVRKLTTFISRPGQAHWNAAKRVLRYLKGTKTLGITYVKENNFDKHDVLQGYSDTSFNQDIDAKLITGYVFSSAGTMVTWGSRKQGLMALSATEAECLMLIEAMQEALWLHTLLNDLSFTQMVPTPIEEDNQSTIALTENPQFH